MIKYKVNGKTYKLSSNSENNMAGLVKTLKKISKTKPKKSK